MHEGAAPIRELQYDRDLAGRPSAVRAADPKPLTRRSLLIALLLAAWLTVTWFAGLRQGFTFLTGTGLGAVLAGVSFGFTTGWRVWLRERDPTGILAQFVAIGVAMAICIPLLAARSELVGAYGPLSVSLVLGAFVFGAAMQLADGCGSGTLYKAGQGNAVSLAALPGFVAGSFLGAAHLDRWLAIGSLPAVSLPATVGAAPTVALQAVLLVALGLYFWRHRRRTDTRWRGRGVYLGAVLLALFAVANLLVAGQPWGIVYGLGLWGAKLATWMGADLATNVFWGREAQQAQIAAPLLDDVTSASNLGLLLGAFAAASWRRTACPVMRVTGQQWLAAIAAGLVLGYSSRLAFGCNVGAYFSGISTGSLHGWIWFAAAFAGSALGVRLRARLGFAG
jgi:uncharacterized membrane protein YedE/YeeE